MQATYKRIRPVLIHLSLWLGFAAYEQLVTVIASTASFDLIPVTLTYLLNAALFYTNSLVLLPKLYARQHYVLYAAAVAALLLTYGVLRCELYLHVLPALHLSLPPHFSYQRFLALAMYRGTFFQAASMGYWFALNVIQLERQKNEQTQHLRAAEQSLLEANLAFLRSQINPHFLFNSLNFLYAQVYPHSQNAAKGILLLSDTMRYALHEEGQGKVMLTQEVEHLQNYIAINQLRFSNTLQVQFEVVGSIHFLMILPLVLITFVENCFKHGDMADAANPITIRLVVVQNQLSFQTRNKKRLGPKEKSSGIGLANTRKRLDLTYQELYSLVVNDEPDYYTCSLTIQL